MVARNKPGDDRFAKERGVLARAERAEAKLKSFAESGQEHKEEGTGEDDKTRGEGSSLSAVIATTFLGSINLIIATVFAPRRYVTVALHLAPRFSPAVSHPCSHVHGEAKLPSCLRV